MANHLKATKSKGILRQMPGVGVARIVPATATSGLSTFTQQGAYPGVPVLDSPVSALFLKVTGTIPEDEAEIVVETLHGGMVGPQEASFMFSQAVGDDLAIINTGTGKGSLDVLRGWEWPGYVTHYEALLFDDDPLIGQPDCLTLSDGRIFQVYVQNNGTTVQILLKVRDPITGVWGAPVVVFSTTDTLRSVLCPCVVRFLDDRVVVYFFNYIAEVGTTLQIQARVVYPTDYTVEDYEVACCKETLATATYGHPNGDSQLRGAMKSDGSVMLVCSLAKSSDNHILQLGSYDYGHSFTVVSGETTATVHHHFPDVEYLDGQWTVTYVNRQADQRDEVTVKALSHWFDSLEDTPELTHFELQSTSGADTVAFSNALCATPDGRLYNVNTVGDASPPTLSYGQIRYSADLGTSWENSDDEDKANVGYDAGDYGPSWYHFIAVAQETCAFVRNACATYQGSRVYVGACFTSDSLENTNEEDGSLLAFYLGGWSNQQKAFFDSLMKVPDGQLGYDMTAFGFIDPQANGWTRTTAGAASAVNFGSRRIITTNDGGKEFYSRAGGTNVSFASVEWAFLMAAFNVVDSGDVGVEILIDNGTQKYNLGLYYLSTGGIRLRDKVAGSTIANIPIVYAQEYTYRIELVNNRFQLFYRHASATEDQVWERAIDPFNTGGTYTGYPLTAAASTGATATVLWGHFFATTTGATGDAISNWRDVKTQFGANLASAVAHTGIRRWFEADYIDYATTDDFHNGHPYVAFPVWLKHGVYAIAAGGPTYDVDEWGIEPAYQYPVENMMPEFAPSPSHPWRSVADNVSMDIVWLVGDDINAALASVLARFPGNETFAAFIGGTNIKTAALYGVDSANAEQKICDIVMTRWSGLTFDNHGDTTKVLAGGGTEYVGPDELAGAYMFVSGKTTPRRITGNTEGQLNATTKTVTLYFDDDGTETQGVDAAAGNCIFMPAGFFVCHDPPADYFKAYILRIPAQRTAEGYYRISTFMFNGITLFGRDPSFGHTTEVSQDNTLLNKTRAGHSESRVYNGTFRVKQLSWEDGIDQTSLDSATPDYIQYGSPADEPAALYHDTARQLYGLFRQTLGGDELVVYCDSIPSTSNTGQLRPERFLFGRMTSSFQESNQLGYEGVNEMVQVTNLVLSEEL